MTIALLIAAAMSALLIKPWAEMQQSTRDLVS
jgi:hypothetical protein